MTVAVGLTGDIMSHLGFVIQEVEGHPYRANFSESVRELCNAQHEMWGNLEGPARPSEDGLAIYMQLQKSCYRQPKLFFPKHYLHDLRDLNFKVLSIANNHCFDFETR